jgi:hypothetical protein
MRLLYPGEAMIESARATAASISARLVMALGCLTTCASALEASASIRPIFT